MPKAPTDLPNLQSWISSSTPYHNVNHSQAAFIDVNDFTTWELEVALCYAIQVYQEKQAELETAREGAKGDATPAAMSYDSNVLERVAAGPIAQISSDDFQQIVMSAKFADDLTYQNCVVGLAVGIQKMKYGVASLTRLSVNVTAGDEDDWFLVGKDETEQREQDKLYAEIEIQLDGALARGAECAEEGDIDVMFAGP